MKERALLIVPHQDDEINLVGNILDRIVAKWEVYVLYSSLDSNKEKGIVRKNEALEACKLWGIDVEHIVFLEYPDTPNAEGKHFYTSDLSLSRKIVDDLKNNIYIIKPEVIFATDFDFHSDHRMISLAFDTAMGEILNTDRNYTPLVLKGFCYETAFYGPEDYKASEIGESSAKNEEVLSNPSYLWNERISIKSNEPNRLIWNRKAYKGLSKHKSQYAVLHARSIINDDNVFWLRRTDNLLRYAKIVASSGDVSKLNDFKILDTDDIITINPREISYKKALWMPDSDTSEIIISFSQEEIISEIIIHGNPSDISARSVTCSIYVEEKNVAQISEIEPYGRDTKIKFDRLKTNSLVLKFMNCTEEFGISEIEIFQGEVKALGGQEFQQIDKNIGKGIIDVIDVIGYSWNVFWTRVIRKMRNTFYRK